MVKENLQAFICQSFIIFPVSLIMYTRCKPLIATNLHIQLCDTALWPNRPYLRLSIPDSWLRDRGFHNLGRGIRGHHKQAFSIPQLYIKFIFTINKTIFVSTADKGAMNFKILEEGVMDIIIIHLIFPPPVWELRKRFLKQFHFLHIWLGVDMVINFTI